MKRNALLPVITYPDPISESVAANVVGMAAQLNVALHILAVNVDFPPISSALSRLLLNTPEMIRAAEATSRKRSEEILAGVNRQASQYGVEITTDTMTAAPAFLGDTAATHARYFDLVFVGWEANNPTSRMTAEAIVFGSGRPTILVPEVVHPVPIDHVAIAWDGSRVAARAVADATPLLQRAAKISVLTIIGEKPLPEKDAGARLATSLQKRGLSAEAVEISAEDCPISATLQQRAIDLGATLLVMGGFGHSRVRDFVLGGATEGVFSDLEMPVLLSH
ncbi:MAG: universal stress protein [Mesorhizobium sp.]|nr:universal stress protein [Mesorhizobium sp.]RUV73271.1 universal stress protein [Mesorhizobium sp. M5C.F.Cr.IN.023.01.1.1]RWF86671.1 MAG: universal stress protein [Mesorhizobium sp.]RWF95368.1 MAG: universal stress protein [Mesorhizobium sp.]RWI39999.1 MAG: universal stress protein [Mesorhizobium sp.]RWI45397.1 MAG: universal stress protein [Mesorhizobium sp.]